MYAVRVVGQVGFSYVGAAVRGFGVALSPSAPFVDRQDSRLLIRRPGDD
jgi:hypothetical protein